MFIETPGIHQNADGTVEIVGSAASLDALGHLLIAKARLGNSLSATFSDGSSPNIRISFIDNDELGDKANIML